MRARRCHRRVQRARLAGRAPRRPACARAAPRVGVATRTRDASLPRSPARVPTLPCVARVCACSGPLRTARQLVASGGVGALWRGLGPTVARVFFGAGIYFSSIHAISDALKGRATGPPGGGGGGGAAALPPYVLSDSARTFVAGFSARTLAAALLSPVAVVKTRMEWTPRAGLPYRSTLGGVAHIARTEGVSALYSGLIPTLVRDSPFSGLYFTIYSQLKAL